MSGAGTPAALCPRCSGRGRVRDHAWPSGWDLCPRCDGRRVIGRPPTCEAA